MKPTIGRIVHYVNPDSMKPLCVLPAIIVRVWSDVRVNLQVFTDGTNSNTTGDPVVWATSSLFDDTESPAAGTWHWPPKV